MTLIGTTPYSPWTFSIRFARQVVVTRHARFRMVERDISDALLLLQVIADGVTRYRDADHLWAWLEIPGRPGNLCCAVLVLEDALVVKTVLHYREWMP